METPDYCRQIETYLCQKNDGHLIRIVGPSFELVSRWAGDGVPIKVAFRGIDRYFDRYYRKGPRRRPVRIDFCEADVRDAFDEWRRALGLPAGDSRVSEDATVSSDQVQAPDVRSGGARKGPSVPSHLERALMLLTGARVAGRLGEAADPLIDRVSRELDVARASARGLRGEARQALAARLEAIDEELLRLVWGTLDESARRSLQIEAEDELTAFRAGMAGAAYERARRAAINRLIRERCGLPILSVP